MLETGSVRNLSYVTMIISTADGFTYTKPELVGYLGMKNSMEIKFMA